MVKRKHIVLCLLGLSLIFYSEFVRAVARLPVEYGSYYQTNFSKADRASCQEATNRTENNAKIREIVEDIENEIITILRFARAHDRELLNSERHKIEQFREEQRNLKKSAENIDIFQISNVIRFITEYGLLPHQSAGLRITHRVRPSSQIQDPNLKQIEDIQEIALFYKYQFYQENNLIITGRFLDNFSNYNNGYVNQYADFSIFGEYVNEFEGGKQIFHEIGISARKYLQPDLLKQFSCIFSLTNNLKFANYFSLVNHFEYRVVSLKGRPNLGTIYEKISVEKEILANNIKLKLGFGSFLKKSLNNQKLSISGFTASIGLNI